MDLGNAALLGLMVFVGTEFARRLFPIIDRNPRIKVAVVLLLSFGVVFLVRETVWAKEQVIGSHPLDTLSAWDVIVVALFLAAIATGINVGLSAVRNIGQNQPPGDKPGGNPAPIPQGGGGQPGTRI